MVYGLWWHRIPNFPSVSRKSIHGLVGFIYFYLKKIQERAVVIPFIFASGFILFSWEMYFLWERIYISRIIVLLLWISI